MRPTSRPPSPAALPAALIVLAFLPRPAWAEGAPKFEFGKQEVVPAVVWKAQGQAGLIATTGNAQSRTASAGLAVSRNDSVNKLAFDFGGSYARSSSFSAIDANGNGFVDPGETSQQTRTTSNSWAAKLRYDRFLTTNNSLFATAAASADQPAGKKLISGGQVGYSRQVFHDEATNVVAEAGYDFAYERYVTSTTGTQVHSARLFAGADTKIGASTGLALGVEGLFNLNEESTPTGSVAPLGDMRLNGKASVTTKLYGRFNLRVAFTARYDHAPAPLPKIDGKPYAPGFLPVAETLDTLTEISIIVTLL